MEAAGSGRTRKTQMHVNLIAGLTGVRLAGAVAKVNVDTPACACLSDLPDSQACRTGTSGAHPSRTGESPIPQLETRGGCRARLGAILSQLPRERSTLRRDTTVAAEHL